MDGNREQLRIHIRIEGRSYPLYIDRKDEERYRIAAKMVNETVSKYKELFRHNDSQDILAMAAFQTALELAGMKEREDRSLFMDALKDLKDDISDFLTEKVEK